jgi:hypothetical protein
MRANYSQKRKKVKVGMKIGNACVRVPLLPFLTYPQTQGFSRTVPG